MGLKLGAFLLLAQTSLLASCAHYQDMKDVKLIGFSESVKKGKSVSQVVGSHCQLVLFGRELGSQPSTLAALASAQAPKEDIEDGPNKEIRYLNNAHTAPGGFVLFGFGAKCTTVKGGGFL